MNQQKILQNMKFPKPLADRVIILPDPVQEEESVFKVLDESKDRPHTGVVKAVGIGVYAKDTGVLIPNETKPGDRVQFSQFAGGAIAVEGVSHLLIRESDISLILPKPKVKAVASYTLGFGWIAKVLGEGDTEKTFKIYADQQSLDRLSEGCLIEGQFDNDGFCFEVILGKQVTL